jgi:hypothetical protein
LQQALFFRFSLEIRDGTIQSFATTATTRPASLYNPRCFSVRKRSGFFVQRKMLIMNRLLHIWIHFSATKNIRSFVASRNWVGGGGFSGLEEGQASGFSVKVTRGI